LYNAIYKTSNENNNESSHFLRVYRCAADKLADLTKECTQTRFLHSHQEKESACAKFE